MGMHACNELRIMEAMKCFPPTRHRTEKSGSKQPELRRIRPGRSTTTRHQDSSRVGPRQAGHIPPTASQASHAASRIEHRPHRSSFTHHRPPGVALCRPSPGSQTAATGLTPPTTDRDRSSEASCRTSIEPLHSQPLSSPVASFSARRSPPPSDPSWGRHRLPVDCFA